MQSEKANLTILFDRYIPPCLETLRSRFKKITPISEISMIQTLCYLLETLLTPDNAPPDSSKELYEIYFVFAAVWAFGGAMFQDQVKLIILLICILYSCVCMYSTCILNIYVHVHVHETTCIRLLLKYIVHVHV